MFLPPTVTSRGLISAAIRQTAAADAVGRLSRPRRLGLFDRATGQRTGEKCVGADRQGRRSSCGMCRRAISAKRALGARWQAPHRCRSRGSAGRRSDRRFRTLPLTSQMWCAGALSRVPRRPVWPARGRARSPLGAAATWHQDHELPRTPAEARARRRRRRRRRRRPLASSSHSRRLPCNR